MDKLTRVSLLCQLVADAGGAIDGRKKLHKLVYLAQRAGSDLGQSFGFHLYGVYSPSLAQDLQQAAAWDLLEETPAFGNRYSIRLGKESLGDSADSLTNSPRIPIVTHLAKESPGMLEALSTIVYLWDIGYREAELVQMLRELKGHLEAYFKRAFDLAHEYFGIEVSLSSANTSS